MYNICMAERAPHRDDDLVPVMDIEREINNIAEVNPPDTDYAVLAEIHTLIKYATHIERADAELLRSIIRAAIGGLKVLDDTETEIPPLRLYTEKRS